MAGPWGLIGQILLGPHMPRPPWLAACPPGGCDLKVGMEQLVQNATFRCILATLLAVGNFLNGSQVS